MPLLVILICFNRMYIHFLLYDMVIMICYSKTPAEKTLAEIVVLQMVTITAVIVRSITSYRQLGHRWYEILFSLSNLAAMEINNPLNLDHVTVEFRKEKASNYVIWYFLHAPQ